MKIKFTRILISIFLFTNFQISAKAQAVNVQDSLALVDLYNTTAGTAWYRNSNWLTANPVSTWYGITLENNRVVKIDLHVNHLNGKIISSFGNLANLTTLQLYDNQLTSVPPEIGILSDVTLMSLSNNLLNSLPPEIGNLSKLTYLDLVGNHLNSLPSEFGNLSNLKILSLSSNQLTSLPPEFGKLSSLEIVSLFSNQLTSLPPELSNLTNLTTLYLRDNQLNFLPPEFGSLPGLSYLDLSYNQLNTLPHEFGNLSKLSHLDLLGNQLSSLPSEFGNLSKLSHLDLLGNQLSSLPSEFGKLAKLNYLYLDHNHLNSIPPEIGNLSKLTSFGLSYNQLSSILPELNNLSNFYLLDLNYNRLTFDELAVIVQKWGWAVMYASQANIPLHQNNTGLSVSAGGTLSNNAYNWYKVEDGSSITIVGDSVFNPSSSGKYYAAVTNSICTQLTLYTDTINYDVVLPVTLINLKAQQHGGMVKVEWTSVTETNVNHYEIQRSANAQSFVSIGSLPATGNGTHRISYSFDDVKPLKGNNYYRLKAFDKDGAITYSNMVLVKMNSDKAINLVYPNPAKHILNIQLNGSASFSLLNQNGKAMITKAINNSGVIDVSHYAAGLYYLKNNNTGEVRKIIVVK